MAPAVEIVAELSNAAIAFRRSLVRFFRGAPNVRRVATTRQRSPYTADSSLPLAAAEELNALFVLPDESDEFLVEREGK
jgi:hypothetical protein